MVSKQEVKQAVNVSWLIKIEVKLIFLYPIGTFRDFQACDNVSNQAH